MPIDLDHELHLLAQQRPTPAQLREAAKVCRWVARACGTRASWWKRLLRIYPIDELNECAERLDKTAGVIEDLSHEP